MSANNSLYFGDIVVGRLSDAELHFLGEVLDLLRAAADGRVAFAAAMTSLLQDLKTIRKNDWDVASVVGPAAQSNVRTAKLGEGSAGSFPPSSEERDLLEDFEGLVEFAVRNGISMPSLLASLMHDLIELSTYGWNLETAKADSFRPKATGWARLNREPAPVADDVAE